jgi:hypothetical protein
MSDRPLIDSLSACGNNESNIDNRIAAAVDELDHCVCLRFSEKRNGTPPEQQPAFLSEAVSR